jgi:IS6 family transposase
VGVEREQESAPVHRPGCVRVRRPMRDGVHRLLLVQLLGLRRPLLAQAHCQEDVGRHLQEFAFPVFGDRFQKVPRAEVRAVADGGVPMRLPVGIIVPVACDALAEETDREEAERRQGEPMVAPEPAQPSPGPVELAGCIPVLLQKLLVIWYNEPQTLLTSEYWRPAMSDPALFKWRHFEAEIILCAVRWYLRYALSYRDVEELMHDRGVSVDHTTVFRWVQRYAPELEKRCRARLNATNDSYRVDETYIKVKKQWYYLYRAVDSEGNTIDFMLSATRDAKAAEQFFRKALRASHTVPPRVITVDKNAAYPPAFEALQQEGALPPTCTLRQCKYLNKAQYGFQGVEKNTPA